MIFLRYRDLQLASGGRVALEQTIWNSFSSFLVLEHDDLLGKTIAELTESRCRVVISVSTSEMQVSI